MAIAADSPELAARSRGLRAEPLLLVLVAATAALDAVASLIRFADLNGGLDLAIFDQAVWHYSLFQAPYSSIHHENLLGDHFHPLVASLAPLYWIWSDPRMLLLAQAALVAASIVPVFLFARSRLGRTGAYLLAVAYAAFWGLQTGVFFDFHEVAFAPLLVALTILFADRRRWGWFWLSVALLLLVKEDLSIYVAFLGVYLLTLRELRRGLALILVGIVWYELATKVFIPDLGRGTFSYWTYGALGKDLPSALGTIATHPWRLFTIAFSDSEKRHTIFFLFLPFLFLTLRSRAMILALPLLAERFLSSNTAMWGTHFHYSMAIAPVLAMGAASGLSGVSRWVPARRRAALAIAAAGAMLVTSVALTRVNSLDSALSELTMSSFYTPPAYAGAAERALDLVPASASLATTDNLLSRASERREIDQINYGDVGQDRYLVADVLHPACCGVGGDGTYAVLGQVLNDYLATMTPIYYRSGWVVARRPPFGQAPANGAIAPMPAQAAERLGPLATRWTALLQATVKQNVSCYEVWARGDPRAVGCFAAAAGPFQREQAALARAVRGVLPSLGPVCRQLAVAALLTTGRLARDLEGLVPAAGSRDRAVLPAALAASSADQNGHDLAGQLGRFLILCSPRA